MDFKLCIFLVYIISARTIQVILVMDFQMHTLYLWYTYQTRGLLCGFRCILVYITNAIHIEKWALKNNVHFHLKKELENILTQGELKGLVLVGQAQLDKASVLIEQLKKENEELQKENAELKQQTNTQKKISASEIKPCSELMDFLREAEIKQEDINLEKRRGINN